MNTPFASVALGVLIVSAPAGWCGDWPQWRGPTRTGYASVDAPVPASLPKELKPVWKISVGGGFSAPIIAGDKLVYLDEQQGKEVVHLLDTATGQERWRVAYDEVFQDEWGIGPRATPIIDENHLYVQSCRGEFLCLDLNEGKTIWKTSYEKDFGVKFLGSKASSG